MKIKYGEGASPFAIFLLLPLVVYNIFIKKINIYFSTFPCWCCHSSKSSSLAKSTFFDGASFSYVRKSYYNNSKLYILYQHAECMMLTAVTYCRNYKFISSFVKFRFFTLTGWNWRAILLTELHHTSYFEHGCVTLNQRHHVSSAELIFNV